MLASGRANMLFYIKQKVGGVKWKLIYFNGLVE